MHLGSRQTYETMTRGGMEGRVDHALVYWADLTYQAVVDASAGVQNIGPDELPSRAVIIEPDGETDESRSLVIVLPHLNGWTPHHYIRAKTTQLIVAPDSRVVVLPNNMLGQKSYDIKDFKSKERDTLENGNMTPYGKMQVCTLEQLSSRRELGSLGITGYGFGGLSALSIAANGGKLLDITHVNADEVPSMDDRSASLLRLHRLQSGRIRKQVKCIEESGIGALRQALDTKRIIADMAKYYLKSQTAEGLLMEKVMAGSAYREIRQAADGSRYVKIGYVEGSKMFDPRSVRLEWFASRENDLVRYEGPFFRGHPSGENVILYALMAAQGLNR